MDPRRLGQGNSELKDEDASDIFCILHPSSIPAYKAASLIYQDTPQHTISTDRGEVKIREKVEGPHREHDEVGTIDLATQGIHSCDIALRLSSNLKNVALGGFLFGRNKSRCDIVLGQEDEVKRISNIHFRIYINEFGIIMLEDQSTNGTVVDNVLLRAKDKENGTDFRHTLEQGAIITLTMTPPEVDFRFIVRIPQRDDAAETAYNVNLTNYFFRQNRAQAEREERINAVNARQQPVSFIAIQHQNLLIHSSLISLVRMRLELQTSLFHLWEDTSRNGVVVSSIIRSAKLAKELLQSCTWLPQSLMVFHSQPRSLRRDVL